MPKTKIYDYEGRDIVVRYEVKRCIHARECVKGLPKVFDPDRRPWVDPGQAAPDEIAEVVWRCPTGALHFERKDGGAAEPVPQANVARPAPNGPLYVEGHLELKLPDGSVLTENRVALCRCGASQNKPFCDNSHLEVDFRDPGELDPGMLAPNQEGDSEGLLEISAAPNGPVLVRGPVELRSADGATTQEGSKGALCRCGASANKPYCDGSHVAVGFEAD